MVFNLESSGSLRENPQTHASSQNTLRLCAFARPHQNPSIFPKHFAPLRLCENPPEPKHLPKTLCAFAPSREPSKTQASFQKHFAPLRLCENPPNPHFSLNTLRLCAFARTLKPKHLPKTRCVFAPSRETSNSSIFPKTFAPSRLCENPQTQASSQNTLRLCAFARNL